MCRDKLESKIWNKENSCFYANSISDLKESDDPIPTKIKKNAELREANRILKSIGVIPISQSQYDQIMKKWEYYTLLLILIKNISILIKYLFKFNMTKKINKQINKH